jgi:hypothetical protein
MDIVNDFLFQIYQFFSVLNCETGSRANSQLKTQPLTEEVSPKIIS